MLRVKGAEEVLPEATGYSPLQGRGQRILKLRSFLDLTEQVIFGCSVLGTDSVERESQQGWRHVLQSRCL